MIILPYYEDKSIAVVGLGITGNSVVESLVASGAKLYLWDDDPNKRGKFQDYEGVVTTQLDDWNWDEIEQLVLSPGIVLYGSGAHPVVKLAKEKQIEIICDIDLFYIAMSEYENKKFIFVSGTNGKSTTTALICHTLALAGNNVAMGGNIGYPVLSLDSDHDYYIIELSSYQLDIIKYARCHIAVLLNIGVDHIDHHGSHESYINAKLKLFSLQTDHDIAVIGVDDIHCMRTYHQLLQKRMRGRVIPISLRQRFLGGITVIDNTLYNDIDSLNFSGENGIDMKLFKENMPGVHNQQNIAFAMAVCYILKVRIQQSIEYIKNFRGLAHRMQKIASVGNITFINDSKATNLSSALRAITCYDNIYWIAGGKPKNDNLSDLKEFSSRIKKAFLIGQAQDLFANHIKDMMAFEKCDNLQKAFNAAVELASQDGSQAIILLSPACASFDQWSNFEARGKAFCDMVNKFQLCQ